MNSHRKTLFARIAQGEKAAFDEFFAAYYGKLVGYANLIVDSTEQAEDVVSDVLTTALTQREKIFALDNCEAYLFTAVKNKALSVIRRSQVAEAYSRHLAIVRETAADAHDVLVAREFQDLVTHVIERLPPKRRMVFELVRNDGMSYAEVGELMDISVRTVEVHLRLAVRELRQKVDAYLMSGARELTFLH